VSVLVYEITNKHTHTHTQSPPPHTHTLALTHTFTFTLNHIDKSSTVIFDENSVNVYSVKNPTTENSNLHGFELHRPSSPGKQLLFQVIKAAIKQLHKHTQNRTHTLFPSLSLSLSLSLSRTHLHFHTESYREIKHSHL